MPPLTPRTRRRRDILTELDLCYRDQVAGDSRIPWFSRLHNQWLEEHFGLEPETILELYQNDAGLVGRASSLILALVHDNGNAISSSRIREPLGAEGVPAWFSPEHNVYLRATHTGGRSVQEIYQNDPEMVERVKQLLVRELSTIGRTVPAYDDQQELSARLAVIGNPPAYAPPDRYTLFGDSVPGNMWEQADYIIQAFYDMTEAQVAQLPDGIREQVYLMRAQEGILRPQGQLDSEGMLVARVPYRLTLDREYSQYLRSCSRDDIADMSLHHQATAIAVRRLYNSELQIEADREWWQRRGYMLVDERAGTGPWRTQREDVRVMEIGRHRDDVFDGTPRLMPYVNTNVLGHTAGPQYTMMVADDDIHLLMEVDGIPEEQQSNSSSEAAPMRDVQEEAVETLPDCLRIGYQPRTGFSVPSERPASAGRTRPVPSGNGTQSLPRPAQGYSSQAARSAPQQRQIPVRPMSTERAPPSSRQDLSSFGRRRISPTAYGNMRSPPPRDVTAQRPQPRAGLAGTTRTLPATRTSPTTAPTRRTRAPATPTNSTQASSRTTPAGELRRRSPRASPSSRFTMRSMGDALRSIRPGVGSRVSRPMLPTSGRRQRQSNVATDRSEQEAASPRRRRSPRTRRPSAR